jgi:predicted nucleotidyltransferase component of viral defense system
VIPIMNITAWSTVVPWPEQRQIEQDLIISRAIIALFSNSLLSSELRFRGGTALNKLHFPQPLRYSEDIELVRTSVGPVGSILDEIRTTLEPCLGKDAHGASPVATKLVFKVPAEDGGSDLRLKVEINLSEITAFDAPQAFDYRVENPWFSGAASIISFSREELIATKLRALLQRDKGRDLFDLAHALTVFDALNNERVVECFGLYLKQNGQTILRSEAEQRMFAKLSRGALLTDLKPLLSSQEAERLNDQATKVAFQSVFSELIELIPGEAWSRTEEMKQKFRVL